MPITILSLSVIHLIIVFHIYIIAPIFWIIALIDILKVILETPMVKSSGH